MMQNNPIYCAIDTADLAEAENLARTVSPFVGGLKIGLQFFLAHGAEGYKRLAILGLPIFLDMKLLDIPNTVAGAIESLLPLRPEFISLYASGGPAMMRAAAATVAKAGKDRPKLLAVTVLTSMNSDDLAATGQDTDTISQVLRLAKLAKECGIDGVACSPEEISPLRTALSKDFILMVPGIRPVWADANDQKRTLTPRQAREGGADYIVVGRPITRAEDPAQAAQRIADELA